MRTDSLRISEEALAAAGDVIRSRYGAAYYAEPRRYKPKSGAQDAHEAIRPTVPGLTPDEVEKSISGPEAKLYRLIWSRFIASQKQAYLFCLHDETLRNGAHPAECAPCERASRLTTV